ncbi:uncharacterized protein [Phyllobates terribilis]|uniref:uncharacterized protein n=1 Tax=Phyllobates terribilis TaxID=111132 RepID=UPI003CCB684B
METSMASRLQAVIAAKPHIGENRRCRQVIFGGDFNTVTRPRDRGGSRDKLTYDSVALNSIASEARLVDVHIRHTAGHEGFTYHRETPRMGRGFWRLNSSLLEEAEIRQSFEDFLQSQEIFPIMYLHFMGLITMCRTIYCTSKVTSKNNLLPRSFINCAQVTRYQEQVMKTTGGHQILMMEVMGGHQILMMEVMGGHQILMMKATGGHQILMMKAMGGHQILMMKAMGGHQILMMKATGGHQILMMKAMGGHQILMMKAMGGHQILMMKATGGHQILMMEVISVWGPQEELILGAHHTAIWK